jgi:site-specific recombinase XerD
MLSEKGVGIEVIQKLMGHTSINTTSIYIDVSDKAKDAAINLL